MIDLEIPESLRSSAEGGLYGSCDGCGNRVATAGSYVVTRVTEVFLDARPGRTVFELVLCEGCRVRRSQAFEFSLQAELGDHIDAVIADAAFRSEYRTSRGDEFRDARDLFDPGPCEDVSGERLGRDLCECRLCGQRSDAPPAGFVSERFITSGQFSGDRLVLNNKRRMTFGLPFVICGCCEALAAKELSDDQASAVRRYYRRAGEPEWADGPVLPLLAENFLGQLAY